MNLGLQLQLVQSQNLMVRLDQIKLAGGASETIFSEVEKKLAGRSRHFRALRMIAKREQDSGFLSVVDFLFVAAFPAFRDRCFAFYSGDGPALRFLLSEAERSYAELRMLALLEVVVTLRGGGGDLADVNMIVNMLEAS